MQPVDAFLEKCVATRHRFVVAPVVGRLQAMRHSREMSEHHLADDVLFQQLPQADGERLVMIVFSDQDHALGRVPGGDDRVVVGHPNERRFFDEDVFAGGKRLQRQVEMKTRRHRNDDRVNARVVNG